jgi:hypothetical protein
MWDRSGGEMWLPWWRIVVAAGQQPMFHAVDRVPNLLPHFIATRHHCQLIGSYGTRNIVEVIE